MTGRILVTVAMLVMLVGTNAFASTSPSDHGRHVTTGNGSESEPGVSDLYLGALPAPAALAVAMPPSITDLEAWNLWGAALKELSDATRQGGAGAVAAWETLLVVSGIPVLDDAGQPIEVDGQAGAGYAVTSGELRLLAALAATQGGMTVAELGEVLEGVPGLEDAGLAALLAEGINGYSPESPELTAFRSAVWSLDTGSTLESFLRGELGDQITPDEMRYSWGQIALLLRRLGTEAVLAAADQTGQAQASPPERASRRLPGIAALAPARLTAAVGDPCAVDEDIEVFVGVGLKSRDFAFGTLLDQMFEQAELEAQIAGVDLPPSLQRAQKALKGIGMAQLVASWLSILARLIAIKAEFELKEPPLRRTKDQQLGEIKDLRITMSIDKSKLDPVVKCLKQVLAFGHLPIDIPLPEGGAQAGIEIDLYSENKSVLLIGDGAGGPKSVTRGKTGEDGVAPFKVSGAPQRQKLPAVAQPIDVQVDLRAVTNLESNDLKKDLIDLPFDAAGGPIGAVIQKLVTRTKWLTFHGSVPVTDWRLDAEFVATLTGFQVQHEASNVNVIVDRPCKGGKRTSSTDQEIVVSSDPIHVDAVLWDNPRGNWGDQVVLLIPHGTSVDQFLFQQPMESLQSAPVLFRLPAAIQVTRSAHEPGTGELPPPLEVKSVCAGDGGIRASPPRPDCGSRELRAEALMAVPSPRRLFPFFAPDLAGSEDLFEACGRMELAPGQFATSPGTETMRRTGGRFPAIDEIFDPAIGQIDVLGTAVLLQLEPGWRRDAHYEWTLTLCRLTEGVAAC